MKCNCNSTSGSEATLGPTDKKRKVAYSTFPKWRTYLDRECQTISWLECDTEPGRKRVVAKLRCAMCVKFRTSISSSRNFSHKWILGAESIRSSNIRAQIISNSNEFTEKRTY